MANIQPYVDVILAAVYGEQVRTSIANAILAINDAAITSLVMGANNKLVITFQDGHTYISDSLKGEKGDTGQTGAKGDKGDKGDTGNTGATGNGIASIALYSTSGTAKTYRITYTNGGHFDFVVTDGEVSAADLQAAVTSAVAHAIEANPTTVSGKIVPNLSVSDLEDIAYNIGKRRVVVKDVTRNLYFNVLTAESKNDGYRVILTSRDGSAFIDYQYTIGGSVEITARASVTVNQVYDSRSTNAQSGTAVAGALKTIPNYQTKTTVDNVLVPNTKYILGEQSTLTLTLPTTVSLGQTIEISFSSGGTACNLACDLQGFNFVPQTNKTNKIVFEYVASGKWTVSVKESA